MVPSIHVKGNYNQFFAANDNYVYTLNFTECDEIWLDSEVLNEKSGGGG